MRTFGKAALLVVGVLFSTQAFAWAADFVDDSDCTDEAGVWIVLPDGRASFYADGADGGGSLSFVFRLVDETTTAADPIDPALVYTSDGTGGIVPVDLGAGWKVCAKLDGSTAPDMHVEVHPLQTRTVDGNLKYRY
jgi:hypothetical protein